ncbi:MAG: LiaF domain-containing protein [Acidimicrobiia bacterium]
MRKLAKALVKFLIISAVLKVAGIVLSRAFEGEGTASDDDFKLMAIMDGRAVTSEAGSLRTGTAIACMGGIDIDLRGATLDPGGAHIALKAFMGGIRLLVPATWKVYVDVDSRAGEIEIKTSDPESLDDDASRITVEAITRAGGILIATED